MRTAANLPLLNVLNLSLNDWLAAIRSADSGRKYFIADYAFPTDKHREEYLAPVSNRDEKDIRDLIRRFLVPAGHLRADVDMLERLLQESDAETLIDRIEFYRRLLNLRTGPWEGMTWVLDLLPRFPKMAHSAVDAYFTAHLQFLPDGRYDSLSDVLAIIRARYLEKVNPRDTLLALDPRDFEYIVAAAYHEIGYDIRITPRSSDGGLDIEIRWAETGRAETSFVECKRYDGNVGVVVVRALIGVVSVRNVNKGILVTTGAFTKSARDFACKTAQLDLVEYHGLNRLLNTAFGPEWPRDLDHYICQMKRYETEAASAFIPGHSAV